MICSMDEWTSPHIAHVSKPVEGSERRENQDSKIFDGQQQQFNWRRRPHISHEHGEWKEH